jgi:hypothetical protein
MAKGPSNGVAISFPERVNLNQKAKDVYRLAEVERRIGATTMLGAQSRPPKSQLYHRY